MDTSKYSEITTNKYTANIESPVHHLVDEIPQLLKDDLKNALIDFNSSFQSEFDTGVLDRFAKYLHNKVTIYKVIGLLDVKCIIQRELALLKHHVNVDVQRIIRMDGKAGRMVHMHTMLWDLYDPLKKPLITCVDIDPTTVEAHQRNPHVDLAVHNDIYKYLLMEHFEGEHIGIYLDFCSLAPCTDEYLNTCEYNASMLENVLNKYSDVGTLMLSHSTQGWRQKSSGRNKNLSWAKQLSRHDMQATSPTELQKHLFRTSWIELKRKQNKRSHKTLSYDNSFGPYNACKRSRCR